MSSFIRYKMNIVRWLDCKVNIEGVRLEENRKTQIGQAALPYGTQRKAVG